MKNFMALGILAGTLAIGVGTASAHDSHRYGHRHGGVVVGSYTKNVLVRSTHTHYRNVQVRYKLVSHSVLVRPARRIAHRTRAITRRVAETVMVRPARRIWTIYHDAHGNKIGCWKDKPARFSTRYRTVLVRPAGVRYSVIPAQYRTVTRKVRAHY